MEENRETGLFLEQSCMNEPETLRLSMCTKHIYKVEFQEEFYLLFDRKSEFWTKFRNSGSTCLCQHETSHTICYRLVNCLIVKMISFRIGTTFTYENCDCFSYVNFMTSH